MEVKSKKTGRSPARLHYTLLPDKSWNCPGTGFRIDDTLNRHWEVAINIQHDRELVLVETQSYDDGLSRMEFLMVFLLLI